MKILKKVIKGNKTKYSLLGIKFSFPSKKRKSLKYKDSLEYIAVHIAEHCNLNCKSCNHFSPLAEKKFTSLEGFRNDMCRLSKLFEGKINRIGLMGGEPLLNPEVNEFMKIARYYFPLSTINLVTNGILLLQQKNEFWDTCRENNIEIVQTKYPIKLDFDKIAACAAEHNVKFKFYGNTGEVLKKVYRFTLDMNGRQKSAEEFSKCFIANECIFLSEGKLSTCTMILNFHHFNKYFKKNIKVSKKDYIDIYKAKSAEQILEFLGTPPPVCRYCNFDKWIFDNDWEISKKKISEWAEE